MGKGTIVDRLVELEPSLWLSRSWTTRPRRPGEDPRAYTFVDRGAFLEHAERGGFLEWAQVLDHLYGTPLPDVPSGASVLLEIDVQGARQVCAKFPDAVVIFVVAPSREEERARLVARGDDDEHVERRLSLAEKEERSGREVASHVVVNDDLDRAVAEIRAIMGSHGGLRPSGGAQPRARRSSAGGRSVGADEAR